MGMGGTSLSLIRDLIGSAMVCEGGRQSIPSSAPAAVLMAGRSAHVQSMPGTQFKAEQDLWCVSNNAHHHRAITLLARPFADCLGALGSGPLREGTQHVSTANGRISTTLSPLRIPTSVGTNTQVIHCAPTQTPDLEEHD